MGAAPSAELLCKAPFQQACCGGRRTLLLIPLTPAFFPSADCPLFGQLYEARFDPYVRYYTRSSSDTDTRLDYIPSIEFSREEYYEKCMEHAKMYRQYQTNEELRGEYTSELLHDRVLCPVPCALAFQYDNKRNFLEEFVTVGGVSVRVIGCVGCTPKVSERDSESVVFELTIFLRKSAGDHNMVRAMMCAACLFYEHCINECKLPSVPLLPVVFHTLKTNVPFLCFLREIRNRVGFVAGNTDEHSIWVEGNFIRGYMSVSNAKKLCEAFAQHQYPLSENDLHSKQTDVSLIAANQTNGMLSSTEFSAAIGSENTVAVFTSSHPRCRVQKQFFALAGFINKCSFTIPASVHDVSEVYIVCVDAVVRVVCGEKVEEGKGVDSDEGGSCTMELYVRRGDILRFVPTGRELAQLTRTNEESLVDTIGGPDASTTSDVEDSAKISNVTYGAWQVDPDICLENVLLSFLHDECKHAREALADDSHWVRNEETGEPVVEGNFHVWQFEHKGITYYYGTVPKFANDYRKQRATKKLFMSLSKVSDCDFVEGVEGTPLCVSSTSNVLSKTLTVTAATLCTDATPATSLTSVKRGGGCGKKTVQDDRKRGKKTKLNSKDVFLHNEDPIASSQHSLVFNGNRSQSTSFLSSCPLSPLVVQGQQCYANGSQPIVVPPSYVYSSFPSSSLMSGGGFVSGAPLVYEQGDVGNINYSTYRGVGLLQVQHAQFVQQPQTVHNVYTAQSFGPSVQQQGNHYYQHLHHHHHHNHNHYHYQQQQMPVVYAPIDFASNYSAGQQQPVFFILPMESFRQSTGLHV